MGGECVGGCVWGVYTQRDSCKYQLCGSCCIVFLLSELHKGDSEVPLNVYFVEAEPPPLCTHDRVVM